MFKYSYSALVYFGEAPEIGIKRVAAAGYDGIELIGEPELYDVKEVNRLCNGLGIEVSSICSIYNETRDLCHSHSKVRQNALDYMKKLVEFAAAVNCGMMIAQPTSVGKEEAMVDDALERQYVVEGLRKGAEYAAKCGVELCLEPLNRYETYMLHTVADAMKVADEVGAPNLKVMGDTFHMNIEEKSIPSAILGAGKTINHMHFADSTRQAPGYGSIDFSAVLKALRDVEYDGYIAFELLPATADPHRCIIEGGGQEFFDQYTGETIKTIRAIEAKL